MSLRIGRWSFRRNREETHRGTWGGNDLEGRDAPLSDSLGESNSTPPSPTSSTSSAIPPAVTRIATGQVITDVLAGGHPLGAEGAGAAALQRAEVYSSNSDFLWQAGHGVPAEAGPRTRKEGSGQALESGRASWLPQGGLEAGCGSGRKSFSGAA